ncbi:MBL fold metallo-hydrolase [Treponema zioleckii]|uniref:MBL fold metallo-hydrolase n=1 Tax=Treponema zioleckii TaxID=331680 RepID=UPI00168BE544|nr:MBL fold metallo-hydrolase [Treponema zioleckii]
MNIHFWGVRGSIPAPLTPQQIQAKIAAAVQKITPDDIKSNESREKFLASLPEWLNGTVGGNTPCVEVTSEKGDKLIFDAGTGIRVLGKLGQPASDLHHNILFSHFHWDHIQGLPFYDVIYNPKSSFDIYSPFEKMEDYLRQQMVAPYYPVTFDAFTKNITFHVIEPLEKIRIGEFSIQCVRMNHPGSSYSYAITENGFKFVYATDVELTQADFDKSSSKAVVFQDADILVLDSQYTVEEALRKENWGHSAFCYAIDFAVNWRIKKLYLFHHEPTYDDRKLNSILESARWYGEYITTDKVEVHLATEGLDIKL